jgi:hypothetical protein
MTHDSIEGDDFVIRVRPFTKGEQWTGEIDISIISSPDNMLDDESYGQLMHFCKMMCSTVPIMEHDEAIRNMVHTYVMEVVDNEPEDVLEKDDEQITITQEDGNVIRLDFSSKTKGSA